MKNENENENKPRKFFFLKLNPNFPKFFGLENDKTCRVRSKCSKNN